MGAYCCLPKSGQIRFISDDNFVDSDQSSDDEFVAPSIPPMEDPRPNNKKLEESNLYGEIMQTSGRWSDHRWTHYMRPSLLNMIFKRELGISPHLGFSYGDRCVLQSHFLPNRTQNIAAYQHKAFCGIYSDDGRSFLSACQDQHIRVYDTTNDSFNLLKTIHARDVGWSVLDIAFSPDSCFAAYSSWSDCIHLCSVLEEGEAHESLPMEPGGHSFCIFSLKFSSDNKEILGGANDGNIYVYDREANKRTLKIDAHDDDVNAVIFADETSQILYSGGDDGLCKVWDRRMLSEERPMPVGVLSGHANGVTYIDTKGDARFFVSNSKDQTMKLWDIRKFSDQTGIQETKSMVASQKWDYRWQQVPRRTARKRTVKGDSSVMSYRGHCVLHTLIRCKFSPMATTGQRYLYTGCATGSVVIYDLLTGKITRKLEGHSSCVRDVSWHPYANNIVSTSWDCTLGKWTYYNFNGGCCDDEEKSCDHCATPGTKQRLRPRMKQVKEVPFKGLFD